MLGTQLKENHLLFIVSFVFTQDHSREYAGSIVSIRNCNSLKTELKKQTFFLFTCFFSCRFVHTQHILKETVFCGRLQLVLHLCSVWKLSESCSNFLLAQKLEVPVMVSWNPFWASLSKKPNSVPPVSSKCLLMHTHKLSPHQKNCWWLAATQTVSGCNDWITIYPVVKKKENKKKPLIFWFLQYAN